MRESFDEAQFCPSPLAGEGGAKRRMRGSSRGAPLIRLGLRPIHLLPQGEKGAGALKRGDRY